MSPIDVICVIPNLAKAPVDLIIIPVFAKISLAIPLILPSISLNSLSKFLKFNLLTSLGSVPLYFFLNKAKTFSAVSLGLVPSVCIKAIFLVLVVITPKTFSFKEGSPNLTLYSCLACEFLKCKTLDAFNLLVTFFVPKTLPTPSCFV